MRWISVFILIILGWLTILTIQITDLYNKYTEMQEEIFTLRQSFSDYKKEVNIIIERHFEECKHAQLVHEQMCDAILKGMEEW